jgi:hypothetical protein
LALLSISVSCSQTRHLRPAREQAMGERYRILKDMVT